MENLMPFGIVEVADNNPFLIRTNIESAINIERLKA